jgi:tRNA1Val (adenine37-N6)-methyltransferase
MLEPKVLMADRTTKNFHCKQFSITGGESGMPVSTDGILLGAWARIENQLTQPTPSILDIGTGTGLLALMLAQRTHHSQITAIDIDQSAISAAKINFAQSPWRERFTLIHDNILEISIDHAFDMIICNPPYFTTGQPSQQSQRAIARHTIQLDHHDLLTTCWNILTLSGRANFVLPVAEGEQFLSLAEQLGWFLTRKCQVRPNPLKSPNRLLIELSKKIEECEHSELIIKENNSYSQNFISLTKDFYLKM